jgi:hypothetical protein
MIYRSVTGGPMTQLRQHWRHICAMPCGYKHSLWLAIFDASGWLMETRVVALRQTNPGGDRNRNTCAGKLSHMSGLRLKLYGETNCGDAIGLETLCDDTAKVCVPISHGMGLLIFA